MALTTAYLAQTKNLKEILTAIQNAQAPDRFTTRFLEHLGFSSKNDRPIINVLKAAGFLDDAGAPTQRYFQYLDASEAPRVLADGIREAYGDLFRINKNAHEMSASEVENKLRTLTQGKKGEAVLKKMSNTFKSLASQADFSLQAVLVADGDEEALGEEIVDDAVIVPTDASAPERRPRAGSVGASKGYSLNYDVHIHLPATRDPQVYDALFRSLREHLG